MRGTRSQRLARGPGAEAGQTHSTRQRGGRARWPLSWGALTLLVWVTRPLGSRGLLRPLALAPFTLDLGPHSLQAVGVCRAGRLSAWVQRQPVSPSPKVLVSSSVERILLVSSSASDLENLRIPGPLSLTPGLSCTAPSEAGTSGLLDTIQGAQLNLSFK